MSWKLIGRMIQFDKSYLSRTMQSKKKKNKTTEAVFAVSSSSTSKPPLIGRGSDDICRTVVE